MAIRIQLRRDTAANWISSNPVLRQGEMGIETDTLKIKLGDGTSTWTQITAYMNLVPDGNSTIGDYVMVTDIGAAQGVVGLDNNKNAIVTGSSIILEGATDNAYETTLTVTDPTADRTITLPNATGTIALTTDITTAIDAITTDVIEEGSTNKYFSDERAQDAVATALAAGTHTNITVSYNDAANSLSLAAAPGYVDEQAVDAVAAALAAGTHTNITVGYNDAGNAISLTGAVTYTDENAQDAIGNAVGTGLSYNDTTGAISVDTTAIQARVTNVTDTEIGYLDGVTSAIQTQIDAKSPLASPTFTGTVAAADLTLSGNLTVNGTTTTLNSTTISVDDKNIELGSVATPTDVTADGGGITLKGTTDKTFNWVDATDAWTSSEHINLATGKSLYLNGTLLKDATETLTNKTLTSPVISTITNTGTLTLPTTTGTLALTSQLPAAALPATQGTLFGSSSSTAASKTTVGYQAGNASSSNITAVGYQAGLLSTAASNVAIGYQAFVAGTTGTDNTAIGFEALKTNTAASGHTAIGMQALKSNYNSNYNTAVGYISFTANTSGGGITGVGFASGYGNTTGNDNTAIGWQALTANTTGSNQTAVGSEAIRYATGSANTGIGKQVAYALTSGTNNTVLGYQAGYSGTNNLTTGSNNIIIGSLAAASSATVSNQITLGDGSITTFRIPGLSISATTTALTVPSLTPTNAIGAIYGGTGLTSYTTGDILYSSATNTLAKLAAGSNGQILTLAAGVPTWAAAPAGFSAPTIGSTSIASGATVTSISGLVLKDSSSTTITANTATTVDTNALAAFTTAKYLISIKQGTKVRSSEVIVQTDGTSVDMTEFGITETGGAIAGIVISAAVSSTNAVLQVTITDAATTNATVKINEILI
jgi:hypothetical protein